MISHQSILLSHRRRSIKVIVLVASVVIVGICAWLYRFQPLPEYWNSLTLDFLTILVAVAAAVSGTLLIHKFKPGEKPRAIWLWFTLGWWSWVCGELATTGYDIFKLDYGDIAVFDICWTVGYLCFGLALYLQYRHVYGRNARFKLLNYLLMVVLDLLVTLAFTQWALHAGLGEGKSWFSLYLSIFYPVSDAFVGIAALWLSLLFGRGSWGRPWWALIVFAVADSVNIFLWIGGNKLIPENTAILIDWISSVFYNSGYVVAMFGFLSILIYYLNIPRPKDAGPELPA